MPVTLNPPESGTLEVIPWSDPVVDSLGHDPRSDYVEHFWLAILGPSSVWFLRHLAHRFDDSPTGFDLELTTAARAIGLSAHQGRNSPFWRTINRCVQFRVARGEGDSLAVRPRLPPLTQRQMERLPEAEHDHERWQLRARPRPTGPPSVDQAKALAATLAERGEGYHEVHRMLRRWAVPRPMALAITDWAFEEAGVKAEVVRRAG